MGTRESAPSAVSQPTCPSALYFACPLGICALLVAPATFNAEDSNANSPPISVFEARDVPVEASPVTWHQRQSFHLLWTPYRRGRVVADRHVAQHLVRFHHPERSRTKQQP